jgi:hypothetical protein
MNIVENFISEEDVKVIQEYIKTIKFNTKEDHDPLHDKLFSIENNHFDIHTRGEMPDHILEIFSKYSKGFYKIVQDLNEEEYHPPMFSKHYILRYKEGANSPVHHNEDSKPKGTYGSIIVWQNADSGGEITFPYLEKTIKTNPGDLVFFEELELNSRGISDILSGNMFISEAWMGKKGQLWMENRTTYEEVNWDDWEIKGFHE